MSEPPFVVLRFEAPLMAFGDVRIDGWSPTLLFPSLSMVTGLVANALGYEHKQRAELQALQAALRIGSRIDKQGQMLVDYQTADLGRPDMLRGAWTTRGEVESHGGSVGTGTSLRDACYWMDAAYTVVLAVAPPERGGPGVEAVVEALRHPCRPLFLGRKCCLPSAPLLRGTVAAASLKQALASVPLLPRATLGAIPAQWPEDEGPEPGAMLVVVQDERAWAAQVHHQRRAYEGPVTVAPSAAFADAYPRKKVA